MAITNHIPPFPPDIDRNAFGHWLSGFADGEGCFLATSRVTHDYRYNRPRRAPTAKAGFRIALRDDDANILQLIQSFWQVGRISWHPNTRSKVNAKPVVVLDVSRTDDLFSVVVPHFDAFHLRAKKHADFTAWKECVAFLHMVNSRRKQCFHGYKWSAEERTHFDKLVSSLLDARKYKSKAHTLAIPVYVKPTQDQLFLFG